MLLQDVVKALRAGCVSRLRPAAVAATTEAAAGALAPGGREELDTTAAAAAAAGSADGQTEPMDLVAENVAALEGVFHTGVGVDVENEQLCRFLRDAMRAPMTTATVVA